MTVTTLQAPSERDFEAYRQVTTEGKSTRAVAALLEISQTRVCQIVERVLEWLAQVLPAAAERMTEQTRLLLAQHVAVARLENLYGEAMDAWRASQAEEHTQGRGNGNSRYLATAASIGAKLAKLPASLLPFIGPSREPEASTPPVGDCSATASEQGAKAAIGSFNLAVKLDCDSACGDGVEVESGIGSDIFAPVQPAAAQPIAAAARSLLHPPLNRQERRARQKLFDQLRRKAK